MLSPLTEAAARHLALAAGVLLAASAWGQPSDGVKRVPRVDGEWWQVASNPDLGILGSDEAECPFVAFVDGYYYLFLTKSYKDAPETNVFRSKDPLDFGVEDDEDTWVGSLPVAAPELIHHEGQWYVAALRPELDGIRIARLAWERGR